MKKIYFSKIAILTMLVFGFSQQMIAQFKVVGYVPSWNPTTIQYDKLTHINYSFALPQYGGRLKAVDNPGYLQTIVSNAHARGVKVYIAIGGWSDNGAVLDPVFESIGNDPGSRANLINDALYVVNTYNLDGVDMDWEYPDAGNSANNFTTLMRDLGNALHARGKGLSFAGPADTYNSNGYQAAVFQYVDHVNIMAYDGGGAHHSTYQFAVDGFNLYRSKGCPANKLVVGVPFYARPSWRSYASLLAAGSSPNSDWFGSDGYNGIPTIKQKTQFALNNAGGIMIWELSQDAQGANSLLTAINTVVKANNNGGGNATVYKDCNYGGYAVGLSAGDYTLSQLQAKGVLNDDISSLKVQAGYEVVVYEHDNFSGASVIYNSDNSCVGSWNDRASSLRVRTTSSTFSRTIQAESFSAMSGVQTEGTTDAGGGLNVGYIDNGDWMAYNSINFPSSGSYRVEYRVASVSGGRLSLDLNAGSIQLGALNVPATGGWQNWTTISHTVNVNAGTYNVGIFAATGGWNINWIKITKLSGARTADTEDNEEDTFSGGETYFEISPNPVSSELKIASTYSLEGASIRILDRMGYEVMTLDANSSINVSELSSGVYTFIYNKDGASIVRRFVKL
jgi:chitinase